jgi:hypothetical protein
MHEANLNTISLNNQNHHRANTSTTSHSNRKPSATNLSNNKPSTTNRSSTIGSTAMDKPRTRSKTKTSTFFPTLGTQLTQIASQRHRQDTRGGIRS